ncbi:hypothetical protein PM082_001277 [Marasmius tenuissimus]|nr:hypothetical protein PM082_001277 [Marasmius tenuissimus]
MSLPHDVWAHIASFLPPSQLDDLYSLSSTFFNIAMDQRYHQISLSYLTRKMVRTLERIRDPYVAKRVKVLYLHPHFVKDVINRDHSPLLSSNSTLLSRLGDFASQLRDQKLFGKQRSRCHLFKFKTFEDFQEAAVDILNSLPNLTDLHLAWSGLPTVGDSPVPIISASFVPHLRRLWLDISLEKLAFMLPHFSNLQNIEQLDLFIRIDHELDSKRYENILVQFAQTINGLHRTLRKFAIQLWEPLDISSFFSSLHCLPLLAHVSLSIPIGGPHLGDSDAITNFFNLHSASLRSLSIRATELGEWARVPNDIQLYDWIENAFSGVRLSCLASLEISLGLIPVESAMVCIRKFAGTLRSLVLAGRRLSLHDIDTITSAFPHCHLSSNGFHGLDSLRLGSVTLNPQLMDLLAERLPHVSRLELLVRDVVPYQGDHPLYYKSCPDHDQDESQLTRFFEEMERRFYPDWRIRQLVLSAGAFPFKLQHEPLYKDVLRQCAPSLESFA